MKIRRLLAFFPCLFLVASMVAHAQKPLPSEVALKVKRGCAAAARAAAKGGSAEITGTTQQQSAKVYGKLPVIFVPNEGQTDSRVRYYSQGSGYRVYFTRNEVVLAFVKQSSQDTTRGMPPPLFLHGQDLAERGKPTKELALTLRFVGANRAVRVEGRRDAAAKVNYVMGNDPTKWRNRLRTYREVIYRELWPGIDLVFRGANGQLKYEFVLQPGAKVEDIRLTYRGAHSLSLDERGNLLIHTPFGVISDDRPVSYQEIDGKQVPVETRFVVERRPNGKSVYGFSVQGGYDPRTPLVIDPGLVYSTFLGGNNTDFGTSIAVDALGNAYVTGFTSSSDFPTTPGAFDRTFDGRNQDAFVAKLDPTGSNLLFATYLGGSSSDGGWSIVLDASGNVYVAGSTFSLDFPTTPGAFDRILGTGIVREDVFVAKFDSSGALLASTFLGGTGSDSVFGLPRSLAVDAAGNVYVAGRTESRNFPTTATAFSPIFNEGGADGFLAKFDANLSALLYSTFLGGNRFDGAAAVAVVSTGKVLVAGTTPSPNFPTTPGAFSRVLTGFDPRFPFSNVRSDAFIVMLDTNSTGVASLLYGTYIGGKGIDGAGGVGVDSAGNIYVAGTTNSIDFPTTEGAFDRIGEGDFFSGGTGFDFTNDVFVTKLDPSGATLLYSTYLSGCASEGVSGMAVDGAGNVFMTGSTASANFPTTLGAFDPSHNGGSLDVFVAKVNTNAVGPVSLAYSTFLGGKNVDQGFGIALDPAGNVYLTGATGSTDFPTTPGAFDRTQHHPVFPGVDAFVAKLDLTPQAQLEAIIEQILALVLETMNKGQGHALTATLQAAIEQLERGNTTAAANQLQSFIHHVSARLSAGAISPEGAQTLINAAKRIIAQLSI